MAGVRVADIVELDSLGLNLVSGRRGARHPIRWVHVSELEDPTPWLKGGELLLTTGMGLGKSASRQRAYIERLASAGLAGLGFGIGFTYRRVPKAIVDASERLSFPVFEVPYPVPFIAITEAVYSRLSAEQVDVLRRALEAQGALTRAVLAGDGVAGVVAALRGATGGWALALDVRGGVVAASPSAVASRAPRIWEEVRAARPSGPGFALSVNDRDDHVSIHPIGVHGHVEGYLATGAAHPPGQLERIVGGHALSLLALELDKTRALADAERRLRGDLFDALARGELSESEARRGLRRFGFDRADAVAVVAIEAEAPMQDLAWAAEDLLALDGVPFLTAPRDRTLFVLLRPNGRGTLEDLHRRLSERLPEGVLAAAGSAVEPAEAARSLREARYALEVCRAQGRSFADVHALGTYRLLLTLQEPDALRAFADAVLTPLDEYDRSGEGELVPSLQAFLEHNARWESAAAALFVHRHTLRYRMRKVEELTGRDLSSAHDRMEFWLALRAREMVARETEEV
ncbi:MAG TPA: PucR family transcriptional regulator ligand-binding domain-containing protein [Actinomycetota bacterium]|nr:PucR family transcriptional regulator ligand-binding domain-containing protein [Actinomycetota bacterium]